MVWLVARPSAHPVNFTSSNLTSQRNVVVLLHASSSQLLHYGANETQSAPPPQDPHWVLKLIGGLIGGLGLFLYGMLLLSEGLKKNAGERMRSLLSTLTHNRVIAVGVGAFVTMILQSSSATTVMLVSLVQAGLMQFSQTMGIILGADIGTTVTVQLIAFKFTDFSLPMIGIGFGMMMLSKRQILQQVGETLLGFGILFFGMDIMSRSMSPLRSYPPFLSLLVSMENPLLGILVGTVFTALIQSSAAFIGILIILSTQGLLTLEAAIPLLFGANIGTCVTAFLASIHTRREAKRVALAHILFKVVGVLLFFAWIPQFAEIVRLVSPSGTESTLKGTAYMASVVPRQIANAHTLFNVTLAIVMLPFTNMASRSILRLMPDIPEEELPYTTKFLDDSLISNPAMALTLAKSEVLYMGQIILRMVENILKPFLERNHAVLDELDNDEQHVNFLQEKIYDYLTRVSRRSIPTERTNEIFQMLYTVTELEQIADVVVKTLRPRAKEWLKHSYRFSPQGKAELTDYHKRTLKQINRALEVFKDVNLQKAERMKQKFKKYRSMEMALIRTHLKRLQEEVPESVVTSEFHQELIEQFAIINTHATNIARVLLDWSKPEAETAPHTGMK